MDDGTVERTAGGGAGSPDIPTGEWARAVALVVALVVAGTAALLWLAGIAFSCGCTRPA